MLCSFNCGWLDRRLDRRCVGPPGGPWLAIKRTDDARGSCRVEHEVPVDVHATRDPSRAGERVSDVDSPANRRPRDVFVIGIILVLIVDLSQARKIIGQPVVAWGANDLIVKRRRGWERGRWQILIERRRIKAWLSQQVHWTHSISTGKVSLRRPSKKRLGDKIMLVGNRGRRG